ncbi:hypothetical protein E8E14_008932 [Neopestalotiopsis sp. 37M]|nr:hypothetical protein E8E14_008932 [Neopestalotiopsis sp. 37M]
MERFPKDSPNLSKMVAFAPPDRGSGRARWKSPTGMSSSTGTSKLVTENGNQQLMFNSGPGEACTVPLLNGGGPCTINDDGAGTVNSPHSWTTEFNVVYVDEIAGVGFSKSNSKPVHRPKTIDDVTLDLKYFLSTFVSEAFPELHGREFHVTGESYGGIQAISLAYALANPETPGPQPDLSLRSLVASSSFADISYSSPAYYDVLCGREHQYLNRTECATMARAVPECELAALSCRQTISDEHCWAMAAACAPILQFWVPPEKNIVHLKEPCAGFPTCDPCMKAIESYMNNTEVQKKLGLAEDHLIPYVGMDMEVNLYMAMHGSVWLPTSSKYEYLLKNTSVRVLGRGGYLDPDTQPLTVGYSYGGHMPRTLKDATTNTHTFLQQFFLAFDQLSKLDFYVTGESYGGSWVPALGARIIERQRSDLAMVIQSSTGYTPKHINLKGIAIGNGLIRQSIQSSGLFESACKGPDAVFSGAQCHQLEPLASRCEVLESVCEEFGYDSVGCKTAASVCGEFFEVFGELGRNPYDWRQRCSGDVFTCYSSLREIESLMALNATREALGVPDPVDYALLSEPVLNAWNDEDEIWKPSHQYVNYLLDMDVRVLIYVGVTDFLCQYGGMRRLVDEGLSWPHQPSFRYKPLHEW